MINDIKPNGNKVMGTLIAASMVLNIVFVVANLYTMHSKRAAKKKNCKCQEKQQHV